MKKDVIALSQIALRYRDTVNKQWWGRFPGTDADKAGMKYPPLLSAFLASVRLCRTSRGIRTQRIRHRGSARPFRSADALGSCPSLPP